MQRIISSLRRNLWFLARDTDNFPVMMRHLYSTAFLVMLVGGMLASLAGCGFGGPLREDLSAQNYRLGSLGKNWRALKDRAGADEAYEHEISGAVIALNSTCRRYEDSSLETLTKQLVNPFSEREVVGQEKNMLDGREALWTSIRGKLDGVPIESRAVVYRKNRCFFDFMIYARGTLRAQDATDFKNFVEAFRYE